MLLRLHDRQTFNEESTLQFPTQLTSRAHETATQPRHPNIKKCQSFHPQITLIYKVIQTVGGFRIR